MNADNILNEQPAAVNHFRAIAGSPAVGVALLPEK
jgi:hypothetical protein